MIRRIWKKVTAYDIAMALVAVEAGILFLVLQ